MVRSIREGRTPEDREETQLMIFKIRSDIRGGHVKAQVYVGPDEDHLALSGRLILRLQEYQIFLAVMKFGTVESGDTFINDFTNSPTIGDVMRELPNDS